MSLLLKGEKLFCKTSAFRVDEEFVMADAKKSHISMPALLKWPDSPVSVLVPKFGCFPGSCNDLINRDKCRLSP